MSPFLGRDRYRGSGSHYLAKLVWIPLQFEWANKFTGLKEEITLIIHSSGGRRKVRPGVVFRGGARFAPVGDLVWDFKPLDPWKIICIDFDQVERPRRLGSQV